MKLLLRKIAKHKREIREDKIWVKFLTEENLLKLRRNVLIKFLSICYSATLPLLHTYNDISIKTNHALHSICHNSNIVVPNLIISLNIDKQLFKRTKHSGLHMKSRYHKEILLYQRIGVIFKCIETCIEERQAETITMRDTTTDQWIQRSYQEWWIDFY